MIDIAWVGQKGAFMRKFNCHRSPFVDEENNKRYYCIAENRDMIGRRFDEVVLGWLPLHSDYNGYYECLYKEIKETRLKEV